MKRALVGFCWFAIDALLLQLFIAFSFAALWSNSEAEAICLEEYAEEQARAFGTACGNSPSIRVMYALVAVLVLFALVYALRSSLKKPVNLIGDDCEPALGVLSPALKVFLKSIASVLCCILLLVSALSFFAALVAWADSQHVCPFGNQCSDAQAIMWFGSTIGVLALGLFIVLLRFLLGSRSDANR